MLYSREELKLIKAPASNLENLIDWNVCSSDLREADVPLPSVPLQLKIIELAKDIAQPAAAHLPGTERPWV